MAAGPTYEPIATYTATGSISDYTFTSVPGTYTDLVLVISAKNSSYNQSSGELRFNSDTGTNYSSTELSGSGTSASSSRSANATSVQCYRTDITNYGTSIIHINNYANTSYHKSVIGRRATENGSGLFLGLWRSTSAITSITVKPEGGTTFSSGSKFTLFGITAA